MFDDIADRIAIACPDEIDLIVKDMWTDHANGRLTENEADLPSPVRPCSPSALSVL
jgi:hypothetical protein